MVFEAFLRKDIVSPATLFGALFYAVLFLTMAWATARALRLTTERALKLTRNNRELIDRTAATFLIQLAQIGIYLVAFTLYAHLIPELRSIGTAFLTGVSIASVVIGLAAQNTLGNLIAGISLVLYRPFQIGDRIQITGPTGLETGEVENLTLGYTVLKTFDNRRIVVPNSTMASQVMVNLTSVDPRVMAVVPIGIGYTADIDKARSLLLELARSHPLVQEVVGCPVTELGNSSITLSLRAWCAHAGDAKQVEFDLYERAKRCYEKEGIEIPFPYTNIILKKEGPS
ncbi:MAG TPA: mechanosensitive ion channel family protein [Candidatus Manganitrophaceae bacterium]|nr:mechanosensitive ion channel family protein [Candidatus Manganitrophaceae bacterium]